MRQFAAASGERKKAAIIARATTAAFTN